MALVNVVAGGRMQIRVEAKDAWGNARFRAGVLDVLLIFRAQDMLTKPRWEASVSSTGAAGSLSVDITFINAGEFLVVPVVGGTPLSVLCQVTVHAGRMSLPHTLPTGGGVHIAVSSSYAPVQLQLRDAMKNNVTALEGGLATVGGGQGVSIEVQLRRLSPSLELAESVAPTAVPFRAHTPLRKAGDHIRSVAA
eukprot:CAMPEP_0177669954 /NCGR_PEP_ID=MMETSP0447-20121125/23794_1 /TAXON_ID=0 /ORGANISM="Stygamoeba regulata, Strain BSH-02190019" /LENGTH=193 /DNA_ID=CAMNT_0019177011 /DNA_START=20 /DNA_END=598 /DNA_ORIENTATION=+